MDTNTFNELTCGVKKQDQDYEVYSTGIVYLRINFKYLRGKYPQTILGRYDTQNLHFCVAKVGIRCRTFFHLNQLWSSQPIRAMVD